MEAKRLSSESITAKTSTERLRRTIARRRRVQTVTHLFDHSVPESMLFRGVITKALASSPSVEAKDGHKLSPYVIHLKDVLPAPEEILAHEERQPIRLNLLVPEQQLVRVEDVVPETSTEQDLVLDTNRLANQLEEGMLQSLPRQRWTLPVLSFPMLYRKPDGAFSEEVSFAPLNVDAFAPPTPPENFLSYFDFPETEEEHEPEAASHALFDTLDLEEELEPAHPETRSWKLPTLRLPHIHIPTPFGLSPGWYKPLGAFVMISFVFTLPLHAMNVVNELRDAKQDLNFTGHSALGDLEAGASAVLVRDGAGASSAFARATDQFGSAQARIRDLGAGTNLLLSALPVTQKSYKSGKALVHAGEELSIAGQRLADGFLAMSEELQPTPTSRLKLLSTYAESALPHLAAANASFQEVKKTSLPPEQQGTLEELQKSLPVLVSSLEQFVEFSNMLTVILGDKGSKRYLIVFQNNTEIRPTGGFMGSFAEISVANGEITNMTIPGGGTYDLQGGLGTYTIAPKPLQLLSARWEFQDANWFADFPTSARQMLEFYTDAGGPSMDGVIVLNATYVADLFSLLGPIDMPAYERTIDAENFVFETQKIVELEYDREENKPKAFIGDLAPLMIERAMEKTEEDFLSLVDRMNEGLVERDIQLYFTDETLQREIMKLGWAGEVKFVEGDYLMVIDTNLGGGKTDGVIEQDVDLDVNIAEDGSIINTVTITRTHHGIQGSLFSGVNNVDYLRLYVPKGSELLDAEGFSIPDQSLFEYPLDGWSVDDDLLYITETEEIDPTSSTTIWEESGKTVFGNWVQTKPGTASVASFTYRLPFTIATLEEDPGFFEKVKAFVGFPTTETYSLTIQKQSGVLDRTTNVSLHLPDSLNVLWSSHDLFDASFTNHTDAFFGALLEPRES